MFGDLSPSSAEFGLLIVQSHCFLVKCRLLILGVILKRHELLCVDLQWLDPLLAGRLGAGRHCESRDDEALAGHWSPLHLAEGLICLGGFLVRRVVHLRFLCEGWFVCFCLPEFILDLFVMTLHIGNLASLVLVPCPNSLGIFYRWSCVRLPRDH